MGNGASADPWNRVAQQSRDPATRGIDEHLAVVRSYGRGGRPVPDDIEEEEVENEVNNNTPIDSREVTTSNHSKTSKVYPASDRVMPLPSRAAEPLTIDSKNRSGLYVRSDSAPAGSPSQETELNKSYQLAALRRESTTKSFY